ncbi:hypothetical protein AVEN_178879-1 [Araneus ventricosus]|uniref:Uncharacterized protein n=1 Tax=Araneus ventricosus TaxID=182803 RepID=A0A4Y2I1V1_ARAVE|nr:hypothetical protein AVEN_178879-1 [Araneus ventricosus]
MWHARRLTRADLILPLYVPMESPSENLVFLVTYVVKVYAPTSSSDFESPQHSKKWTPNISTFYCKVDASSYTNLNDWKENIADPPILKSIPDEDIQLLAVQKAVFTTSTMSHTSGLQGS